MTEARNNLPTRSAAAPAPAPAAAPSAVPKPYSQELIKAYDKITEEFYLEVEGKQKVRYYWCVNELFNFIRMLMTHFGDSYNVERIRNYYYQHALAYLSKCYEGIAQVLNEKIAEVGGLQKAKGIVSELKLPSQFPTIKQEIENVLNFPKVDYYFISPRPLDVLITALATKKTADIKEPTLEKLLFEQEPHLLDQLQAALVILQNRYIELGIKKTFLEPAAQRIKDMTLEHPELVLWLKYYLCFEDKAEYYQSLGRLCFIQAKFYFQKAQRCITTDDQKAQPLVAGALEVEKLIEAEEKYQILTKELNSLKELNKKLLAQVQEQKKAPATLLKQGEEFKKPPQEEIDALKVQITALKAAYDAKQEEYRQLQAEQDPCIARKVAEESVQLRKTHQAAIEKLEKKNEASQEEITQSKKRFDAVTLQYADLQRETDKIRLQLKQLAGSLKEKEKLPQQMEKGRKRFEKGLTELKQQNDKLLLDIKSQKEKHQAEIEKMKMLHQSIKDSAQADSNELVATYEEKIKKIQAEKQKADLERLAFDEENLELFKKCNGLTDQLNQLIKENIELRNQIIALEEAFKQMTKQAEETLAKAHSEAKAALSKEKEQSDAALKKQKEQFEANLAKVHGEAKAELAKEKQAFDVALKRQEEKFQENLTKARTDAKLELIKEKEQYDAALEKQKKQFQEMLKKQENELRQQFQVEKANALAELNRQHEEALYNNQYDNDGFMAQQQEIEGLKYQLTQVAQAQAATEQKLSHSARLPEPYVLIPVSPFVPAPAAGSNVVTQLPAAAPPSVVRPNMPVQQATPIMPGVFLPPAFVPRVPATVGASPFPGAPLPPPPPAAQQFYSRAAAAPTTFSIAPVPITAPPPSAPQQLPMGQQQYYYSTYRTS